MRDSLRLLVTIALVASVIANCSLNTEGKKSTGKTEGEGGSSQSESSDGGR